MGMKAIAKWIPEIFAALCGNPAPGSNDVDTLEKKAKAARQDRLKVEEDVRRIEADITGKRSPVEALQREIKDTRNKCAELERKISDTESNRQALKDSVTAVENEKRAIEKEIAEAHFYSQLSQRMELTCSPGEDFFLHVRVQLPQDTLRYPEVVRAAENFIIPGDLPPITEYDNMPEWAFPANRKGRVIVVDDSTAQALSEKLFFVGDIHGDADALQRIIEQVFRGNGSAILVFLGDLFDRGERSIDAIRLLFWTARRFPGQILWIAGNHDRGLYFDENAKEFASHVQPSEFSEWVNQHPECKDEGLRLIETIKALPVACVIGDVWGSHGGVPQNDVSGEFSAFDNMTAEMESDCIWARMKDTPAKLPNRSHLGAEVGRKDATAFLGRVKEHEHITIRHMVCAHQHEHRDGVGCVQFVRQFKPGELSCQCLFSFHDREHNVVPCYLEFVHGKVPVPHTV